MIPNISFRKSLICGIQGSGKTECGKFLAYTKFRRGIGFRETPDFDDIPNLVLIEKPNEYNRKTALEELCRQLCIVGREVMERRKKGENIEHVYDLLIIDEADLYFEGNYDLGTYLSELVAMHRHYRIALVVITRRPQDVPAKLRESCQYYFVYILKGKNTKNVFDSVDEDISVLIDQLEYDEHNFIFHELGKKPYVHDALPMVKKSKKKQEK